MESAYVLEIDGPATTVLLLMREKVGECIKVRVKNASARHDVMLVDAWWSKEESGLRFNYLDGQSGHIVGFGPEMADMLMKNCP